MYYININVVLGGVLKKIASRIFFEMKIELNKPVSSSEVKVDLVMYQLDRQLLVKRQKHKVYSIKSNSKSCIVLNLTCFFVIN